ncbi:MAG TPA: hypothetical protein VL123_01820 [Candidatus Udaeobacter sp.]|jgi:hypothetical protein|nr:hypothetical protein [Candidatus Udaeobacter sp.]
MKSLPLMLALLGCLIAPAAYACDHDPDHCSLNFSGHGPAYWSHRHDLDEARFAIMNRNDKVALLITDHTVAMQLSDRVLHRLDRKFRDEEEDDDGGIGHVIKTAVFTSVRSVLNHSAECEIRDISNADYRDGELILTSRNGHRIFGHPDVDDQDVMRDFSPADARAFVRELRQRMAAER